MSKEKLRILLEKALYFFVENANKQELKEQFKWYNVNSKEELIDVMFESYLGVYSEFELIDRINDLFLIDTSDYIYRLKAYIKFLEEDNNSDLFELKIGVIE